MGRWQTWGCSRATSYKVRPPLFTATYLQFYNKSSLQRMFYYQTIAPWTWSMCQAAARAKDQAASRTFNCAPHLLPHLQSLLYCLFWYCKSYFLCSRTDVPGVTRPPITFPAAQFLYLLPIQGHTPGGGRYFVSDSPKDMIGENISPRM